MAAAKPDYLDFLDNLFGGVSSTAFLDNLGKPAAETQPGATPAPAQAASGRFVNIEGLGDVPIEAFDQWRQESGLADPANFKADDYEAYLHGAGRSGEDSEYSGMVAYRPKDGSKGFSTGRDQWVQTNDEARAGYGFDPATYKNASGLQAFAGNLPGNEKTRAVYRFNPEGSLNGVHFATEATSVKDDFKAMAPALSFLLAPFLGPVVGAAANSIGAAVPALGAMGSKIAASSLVGGGMAGLTGGNVGMGMLTGGVSGGISAANPAGSMFGVTDKATQALINSGINTASKFGINAIAGNKR